MSGVDYCRLQILLFRDLKRTKTIRYLIDLVFFFYLNHESRAFVLRRQLKEHIVVS